MFAIELRESKVWARLRVRGMQSIPEQHSTTASTLLTLRPCGRCTQLKAWLKDATSLPEDYIKLCIRPTGDQQTVMPGAASHLQD